MNERQVNYYKMIVFPLRVNVKARIKDFGFTRYSFIVWKLVCIYEHNIIIRCKVL